MGVKKKAAIIIVFVLVFSVLVNSQYSFLPLNLTSLNPFQTSNSTSNQGAPADELPPPPEGSLSILQSSITLQPQEITTIDLFADSMDNPIAGIDAILKFDPHAIKIISVEPTDLLDTPVFNKVIEENGTIYLSIVTLIEKEHPVKGILATITIQGIEGSTPLDYDFTLGSTIDSNMAVNGKDILTSATGTFITIEKPSPPIPEITKGDPNSNIAYKKSLAVPDDFKYDAQCFETCYIPLTLKFDGLIEPSTKALDMKSKQSFDAYRKDSFGLTDDIHLTAFIHIWQENTTDEDGNKITVWKSEHLDKINFDKGIPLDIVLEFRRTPSIGIKSVDIVPTIFGFQMPEFAWFNSSWQQRVNYTINASMVNGTHINFPVLIYLNNSNFSSAQSNGNDFVFTNSTDNKLNHEIEFWNTTTNELWAWVNIPNLTNDTVISVYWNNSLANNQQNRSGVWNSNYLAVYHFKEGISNATGFYNDSTSNGLNLTLNDTNATSTFVASKIYNAVLLTNDLDHFRLPSSSVLSKANATVSEWVRSDVDQDSDIVTRSTTVGTPIAIFKFQVLSTGLNLSVSAGANPQIIFYNATVGLNPQFHYFTTTVNGTNLSIYWNSTRVANDTQTSVMAGTQPLRIGPFTGIIDEVHIMSKAMQPDWIQTEYNNQNNFASFWSIGTFESAPIVTGFLNQTRLCQGFDNQSTGSASDINWSLPIQANESDNLYATAVLLVTNPSSVFLKATNCGFTFHSDWAITGIVVEAETNAGALVTAQDGAARMVKNNITQSTDRSNTTTWSTSDVNMSHGSIADTWNDTWLFSDINSAGFGFSLQANESAFGAANIDQIKIIVFYNQTFPTCIWATNTNVACNCSSNNGTNGLSVTVKNITLTGNGTINITNSNITHNRITYASGAGERCIFQYPGISRRFGSP